MYSTHSQYKYNMSTSFTLNVKISNSQFETLRYQILDFLLKADSKLPKRYNCNCSKNIVFIIFKNILLLFKHHTQWRFHTLSKKKKKFFFKLDTFLTKGTTNFNFGNIPNNKQMCIISIGCCCILRPACQLTRNS